MKKTILILLIVCLLVLVIGSSGLAQDEKPQVKNITVGMSDNDVGNDNYQSYYAKLFDQVIEDMGAEVIHLDAKGEPLRQIQQIEDLIAKEVDVLVIWPVLSKAVVPSAQKAKEAGIPVLIANTSIDDSGLPYVEGFSGPDCVEIGYKGGKMMAEALGGKGKIVEIHGLPGYDTTRERSLGFHNAIEEYPDIEIVESQPGDYNREKSQKVMENFLTKYAPGEIDGVYVGDDNMGSGAVAAIREAGRDDDLIVSFGCLAIDAMYDDIKNNDLIYGAVLQSPIKDATLTAHKAIQLALGMEIDDYNYFEVPAFTAENIDEIPRPVW